MSFGREVDKKTWWTKEVQEWIEGRKLAKKGREQTSTGGCDGR